MIKYEIYPLGLQHELQKQQDRLSLYKSRLASLRSQGMKDSTLEEYIHHKIDEATVDICFLEIMAAWEVTSVTRSHHARVGTSDAAGIVHESNGATRRSVR